MSHVSTAALGTPTFVPDIQQLCGVTRSARTTGNRVLECTRPAGHDGPHLTANERGHLYWWGAFPAVPSGEPKIRRATYPNGES